jgi:hypothetical protein
MASEKKFNVSFPFNPMLGLLFIGLKVTGHITWSWLWVLSPLWIPAAIFLGLFLLAGFFLFLAAIFK